MTRLALLVAAAFFMEFLDATILTTALPKMAESFHARAVDLSVGVSIYALTLAVFILPSGWVVERYGARAVFTGAIALFTLSSVLCGLSTTPWLFFAARALQGVGGAFMVPVGRLVVLRTTAKSGLLRATALLTWPGLTAPLLGPPLGGWLAEEVTWRAIFFVNLPLGLVGALLAWAWTPRMSQSERRGFDGPGFALAGVALAAALLALDAQGAAALALAALALAAGGLYVGHARRAVHPIVDFAPFRHASFRLSLLGGTAARMLIGAVPFVLPLMFQLGFGFDATRAGLTVTPLFVGNIGVKPFTTPILRRFGFRRVLVVNAGLQAATLFACAGLRADTPWPLVALLLCLSGASRSMHFTALATLPFADVTPGEMGMANLIYSASFQGAFAFGVGAAAALMKLGAFVTSAPLGPFRFTFAALGLAMLAVMANHARLARDAGAQVQARSRT
ncbi:MAG: MFS transporter [Pseudomonadota bacterium]|nr:MFS transporter [Pseudomonadota bacterium]